MDADVAFAIYVNQNRSSEDLSSLINYIKYLIRHVDIENGYGRFAFSFNGQIMPYDFNQ